ncbi:MAG: hypothetical protein NZ651_02550 [Candidatus Bipolaricaulota bacterium]|nr:hypothetical protein [Candidatus Bipolaricaulota bacterium]MDW8126637.1 hypothetical protein [Candidatus Bipolaricaulota bacterium]
MAIFVLFITFSASGAPQITAQVTEIIDGATISARIERLPSPAPAGLNVDTVVRVRYIGVQILSTLAETAQHLNAILVGGKQVFLELDETIRDEAGQILAYVFLDNDGRLMVNAILISTDVANFSPVPGASRYDPVFSYLDQVPGGPPSLACPVVYSWSDASKYVGTTACIEGPVASVGTSRAGDVFLNLGRPYPDPARFTLYIPARYVGKFEARFGARFWTNIVGRSVRALGEIRLYQGSPEIQLSDPANLLIL